jgi:type I restriction enzyme S subunit
MTAGWRTTTLGACCQIVSGATPSTGVPRFWEGEIAWATPKDLSGLEGKFISDTERRITRVGLESCAASMLPPNAVLFSSRAPIGHVAINTVPMATNQGFKSFIPNSNEVDPHFLYHWLRARRPYLEGLGNGATFKEVSKAVVSRVEIALPPLVEQRSIAVILDKADAICRRRREVVDNTKELLRSVFLQTFGDPVTNPKGWPVRPFRQLLAMPLRNGLSPASNGRHAARVLTLAAITRWAYDEKAWKEGMFTAEPWDDVRVDQRDFLICRGNGNKELVGRGAFPRASDPSLVFPDTMIAARINNAQVAPAFVASLWKSPSVRSQLEASARTTNGTFKINQGAVEAVEMVCPPRELQEPFQRLANHTAQTLARYQEGQRSAEQLFDSLVARAFSGFLGAW